jgi:hypothetical protein
MSFVWVEMHHWFKLFKSFDLDNLFAIKLTPGERRGHSPRSAIA